MVDFCMPSHALQLHIQGILDVYYFTLTKVELHGPTNFSMFLDKAIEMASEPVDQSDQRYYLLLVITVSLTIQIGVFHNSFYNFYIFVFSFFIGNLLYVDCSINLVPGYKQRSLSS